jgi:hypothetical protein
MTLKESRIHNLQSSRELKEMKLAGHVACIKKKNPFWSEILKDCGHTEEWWHDRPWRYEVMLVCFSKRDAPHSQLELKSAVVSDTYTGFELSCCWNWTDYKSSCCWHRVISWMSTQQAWGSCCRRLPANYITTPYRNTGNRGFTSNYTMGTGSFQGVKWPGRGADHPPPSKRWGHERVGLYLYSPAGP